MQSPASGLSPLFSLFKQNLKEESKCYDMWVSFPSEGGVGIICKWNFYDSLIIYRWPKGEIIMSFCSYLLILFFFADIFFDIKWILNL